MSMQCISDWVSKHEPLCAEIETEYLDFIIDQSGLDYSIIPALEEFSPPLQWQSLYLGLPEESLPEMALLLIRIALNVPLQRQWLSNWRKNADQNAITGNRVAVDFLHARRMATGRYCQVCDKTYLSA